MKTIPRTGFIFLHLLCVTIAAKQAFVIVPVTDLVGQPMATLYKGDQKYMEMPLESKRGSYACPRLHQLIFNESVEIIEETKDEVKIKITNLFYITEHTKQPQTTYWAPKKDFAPYNKLVPPAIEYTSDTMYFKNIISLTSPFNDKKTKRTFSAGTRFVVKKEKRKQFIVHAYNPNTKQNEQLCIPKTVCVYTKIKNNREKRKLFVTLVKQWANLTDEFIPYVWGGCSFTHTCKTKKINVITIKDEKEKPTIAYTRPGYCYTPLPGFDCAGIIARATQIAQIPYFYKNTYTIKQYLTPITKVEDLQDGDLIWYNGHIIIASDIKNNKIIEARTHDYGRGKIHEIDLQKTFKGIMNYEQLINAQNKKQHLQRMDKRGNCVQTIKTFNILQLPV